MINKKDFEMLSDEQIDEAIEQRKEMINQMVGTLYHAIITGEIVDLLELKNDPLRQTRALVENKKSVDH